MSQDLPPAATRQRLLQEGGTAAPWGAQGSEELCQSRAWATDEAGTRGSPGARSLSLQLPCSGVSRNGD